PRHPAAPGRLANVRNNHYGDDDMAVITSTSFKIRAILIALFSPASFAAEEEGYNALLKVRPQASPPANIFLVRNGLWSALYWTTGASVLGAMLSLLLVRSGFLLTGVATGIAIGGAMMLLYATLALQGWPIQSIRGETLAEQVNRWIFRTLYVVGTFLVIWGSAWATLSSA